jgi:hypothetical protein
MNIEFRHCGTANDLHAGIRVIKKYRRETNQQVGCKKHTSLEMCNRVTLALKTCAVCSKSIAQRLAR